LFANVRLMGQPPSRSEGGPWSRLCTGCTTVRRELATHQPTNPRCRARVVAGRVIRCRVPMFTVWNKGGVPWIDARPGKKQMSVCRVVEKARKKHGAGSPGNAGIAAWDQQKKFRADSARPFPFVGISPHKSAATFPSDTGRAHTIQSTDSAAFKDLVPGTFATTRGKTIDDAPDPRQHPHQNQGVRTEGNGKAPPRAPLCLPVDCAGKGLAPADKPSAKGTQRANYHRPVE